MAARSFLGAGDIYIDRKVNGVAQGLKGPFYGNKLSIQPNVDTKQSISKGRNDYGQVIEAVNLPQPADFSLELKEANADVLVMAFLGDQAVLSEAGGTMSAQAVTGKRGAWVPLNHTNIAATGIVVTGPGVTRSGTFLRAAGDTGNFNGGTITVADSTYAGVYTGTLLTATTFNVVSPTGVNLGNGTMGTPFVGGGVTVTVTAGATPGVAGDTFTVTVTTTGATGTLVEGTDYKLNRPLGLIQIPAGSTLGDTVALTLAGGYAGTIGGVRISGATRAEIRCRILFDGVNLADGSQVIVDVPEAVLSADSEFDFLADDFGVVSLKGNLKTPVGFASPFTVDLKAAA